MQQKKEEIKKGRPSISNNLGVKFNGSNGSQNQKTTPQNKIRQNMKNNQKTQQSSTERVINIKIIFFIGSLFEFL